MPDASLTAPEGAAARAARHFCRSVELLEGDALGKVYRKGAGCAMGAGSRAAIA